MINLFSDDPYGHKVQKLRRTAYRYGQGVYSCQHCGEIDTEVPIVYIDRGYAYTANYARCVHCHKIARRYGNKLVDFTLRQWVFTCMLSKHYRRNDNPYHYSDMRYPYPPMTHRAVFGTRD